MLVRIIFLIFSTAFSFMVLTNVSGQPTSGFSTVPEACLNETLLFENTSSQANAYVWDFCHQDLSSTPLISSVGNLSTSGSFFYSSIKMVNDDGGWIGFVSDVGGVKLTRLNFGSDLASSPAIDNLGNPGDILTSPGPIDIVKDGGIWYVFVVNIFQNRVSRLTMGNGLLSTPTLVEDLGNLGSSLSTPIGIKLISSGDTRLIFLSNLGSNTISVIDFGTSFSTLPVDSHTISNPLMTEPCGIDLIFTTSGWRGVVSSFKSDGGAVLLNFGADISSTPIFESLGSIPNGREVKVLKEGLNYVILVRSQTNGVYRSVFSEDFSIVSGLEKIPTNLLQNDSRSLEIIKDTPYWKGFTIEAVTGKLLRLDFSSTCNTQATADYSKDFEPSTINYKVAGKNYIELTSIDQDNRLAISSQIISISPKLAPMGEIDIDESRCLGIANTFVITSLNSLISYQWHFGDTNSSTGNPSVYTYGSAGLYNISVRVVDENNCSNLFEKSIKIYQAPSALFSLPSGTICTNNEFIYINSTLDNFDGNLTYQWFVNDIQKSTGRDFNYEFSSDGDQQIKLKTSIPGCSDELTQTIPNVQTGPVVGFSYSGKCEDEAIHFTNESVGAISGFQWSFGNANTSTLENPVQIYSTPGAYTVSLTATGTNGCASNLTKPITIYSVPQTNFSLDLPPFACSGSLSQFNDITPSMSDSNMATWAWSFGDPSNGNSSQKNPLYAYSLAGDYPVSLTTTTNFGCSNSVQKTVTIYPSPKADFSMTPACINTGTPFTDLSTGDLKSWLWTIQSNTYTTKNPMHTFNVAGSYTALLTVTGKNNCVNQISKNVFVPASVVADFESQSTCATKVARFQEISKGGADPAKSWTWNFAGQSSSTDSISQHTFPATGNFPVTMVTKRASGCSYAVTKMISVINPPKAQFTVFLKAGAAPFPVDFVNTSSRSKFYTWKFGDAANTSSTDFSPSFVYSQLGNYTVQLEASNELGCIDTYIDIIQVVVPQINAAMADFALVRTPGRDTWTSMVTIENKSNVALINPDVYLDISGNALISEKVVGLIEPNASFTYTFSTSIVPRAVDFACAEIKINGDNNLFDNRQCVNLIDESISRSPYPNPASNELTLEWITDTNDPMTVIIYNASGQAIITRQYPPSLKGLNQVNVDVSVLAAGIYFVHYVVDGQNQRFKFSIAR